MTTWNPSFQFLEAEIAGESETIEANRRGRSTIRKTNYRHVLPGIGRTPDVAPITPHQFFDFQSSVSHHFLDARERESHRAQRTIDVICVARMRQLMREAQIAERTRMLLTSDFRENLIVDNEPRRQDFSTRPQHSSELIQVMLDLRLIHVREDGEENDAIDGALLDRELHIRR